MQLLVFDAFTSEELLSLVRLNIRHFESHSSSGLILLVYSVILSRGVDA